MFAGIGLSCGTVAADSICISDYQDNVKVMIGRMELAIGFGITLGPLLGALVYLWTLVYSLLAFAVFVLICCPIVWKLLGTFRVYKVYNIKLNSKKLMFKPVFFT